MKEVKCGGTGAKDGSECTECVLVGVFRSIDKPGTHQGERPGCM